MKKLILFAAVLGLTSVGQAEGEMTHKAEFRVRGAVEQANDLANEKSSNYVAHRFKLLTDYRASDRFSGRLTLMHNALWGDTTTSVPTASTGRSTGAPNSATIDNVDNSTTLLVNEAYATWRVNDELSLKVGRGSYEIADGSLVAVNDWQAGLTAFDGLAAIYELEMARITGFAIKFVDFGTNNVSPVNDAEASTFGVSTDLKIAPEIFNMLNIYAMQVRRDEFVGALPTSVKESLLRYGFTAGGTIAELVNFKASYHGYSGERSKADNSVDGDKKGSMMEVEAGVTMEDMNNLNFYVGYHLDSGDDTADQDDETYDAFYYDVHKNAGLMDVLGWGNLTYIKAGVSADVMENLNIGLHYHMFTATEEADGTMLMGSASGAAIDNAEDDLGSEIDLIATHTYDGGFEIEARYGLFMAGDRFGPNSEDYQQFFLQGTFAF